MSVDNGVSAHLELLLDVGGEFLRSAGTIIANSDNIAGPIAILKERLAALDRERLEIAKRLGSLEKARAEETKQQVPDPASVTMASSISEKIALFRSLFRGREDVLPRRWENPKTGNSGYAPVCQNEWVRGVCGKPQVKCGKCPNQAFISIDDNILHSQSCWKGTG